MMLSLVYLVIIVIDINYAFDRIVGGTVTSASDYPFIVSISGGCGGSIIRKSYPAVILTAAHCESAFDSSSSYVRLNANDIDGSNAGSITSSINKYIIHPNYDGATNSNDIALLFLSDDISSNVNLQSVDIDPPKYLVSECCEKGDDLQVIGYGADCSGCSLTPTLEYVDVDYVKREDCNDAYNGAIDNTMNCAARTNADSCQGDSGGPLIIKNTNKQIGVVSWGYGCALDEYPGVYADISIFYDWIMSQIDIDEDIDEEVIKVHSGYDDTFCEQNQCNPGYFDITGGSTNWWACGVDCEGGKYLTDGYCNCACVDRQKCQSVCKHNRGPCDSGYEDVTNGNFNWWACGSDCEGGKYYTDGVCNCACQDKPDVCPDGVLCGDQGPCNVGYMDKTDGNYNWWACGANCEGGQYWTDGTCNCACVNAGQCSIVPSYHNFNIYRFIPQLSFIRVIGIWGEYITILFIIIAVSILIMYCYKKKIGFSKFKINKYKPVSFDDSSSDVENAPINQ